MNWVAGSSQNTWEPIMTADTTTSEYWLNWKVVLCSIWIIFPMIGASLLIWRFEGPCGHRNPRETQRGASSALLEEETWEPCLKEIHPAWLLAYRVFAFIVMLTLLIINVVVDGGGIFYFYTQWTFTLVTVYFALGSFLSIRGCHHFFLTVHSESNDQTRFDAERGTYVAPRHRETAVTGNITKNPEQRGVQNPWTTAGMWAYLFQIIYQTSAGAVMLTDVVFWLIIFPFLTAEEYNLTFLLVCMHSINAIFLLGDAALNCLKFPWFRFAYFVLWTAIYVIFQWVIHACVSLWWPYPFLDLSSPHAPVWYLAVALLHIPCYGIFALLIKLKNAWLAKWFRRSGQYIS